MPNNFLSYKESFELKNAGIKIKTEFLHCKQKSDGEILLMKAEHIQDNIDYIKVLAPAPTATEMLEFAQKFTKKDKDDEIQIVTFLDHKDFWLVDCTIINNNEEFAHFEFTDFPASHDEGELLIALQQMLLWLKKERY